MPRRQGPKPWGIVILHQTIRIVRDRTLLFSMSDLPDENGQFVVIVAETPSTSLAPAKGFDRLHSVLDDHAHAVLGPFPTQEAAKKAVEGFIRLRRQSLAAEPCACEEIA